jgi:hypothetical protein
VPQAAARRRNASITAASILRITIWPTGPYTLAAISMQSPSRADRSRRYRLPPGSVMIRGVLASCRPGNAHKAGEATL